MSNDLPALDLTVSSMALPSNSLASSVLDRTIPTGKGYDFIMDQWKKMQVGQPSIAQFISATTYRMAPEDPETREKLAISMVRFYILMSEASLQKDVKQAFGESLA